MDRKKCAIGNERTRQVTRDIQAGQRTCKHKSTNQLAYVTRSTCRATLTWSRYHYAARCYQLLAVHNDNGHVSIGS